MEEEKLVISPRKYGGDSKVVSMRVPEELINAIDEVALEVGRTRNEIITMSLEFALERMQIKK